MLAHRFLALLALLMAPLVPADLVQAQRIEFRSTDPALQQLLEVTERLMVDVFNKEFRQAALLAAVDERQRSIISRVALVIDPSACEFAPHALPYEPGGNRPPQIVMGRVFLLANLYVTQAIWFELMRGFQPGAVGRIERYVNDVINRSRAEVETRCDRPRPDGPIGDPIPAYPAAIGMTPEQYAALMREWSGDPAALALGDQLGAIFAFVLMHEVGHHVLGHTTIGHVHTPNGEIDADAFAVRVVRQGDISPTTAVGVFLAFAQAEAVSRPLRLGPSIRCRVVLMLEKDDVIARHFDEVRRWPNTPVSIAKFRPAVERMKDAFLATYRPQCPSR